MFVFYVEVLMRLGVGIEIGMIDIDSALAQKARIGELMERIIDRRERNQCSDGDGFLVQDLRRHMSMTVSKKECSKRHALPSGTQARTTKSLGQFRPLGLICLPVRHDRSILRRRRALRSEPQRPRAIGKDQARSNRSAFITLFQAATKSFTN